MNLKYWLKYACLLIFIFGACSGPQGTGWIEGKVIDKVSQRPVKSVMVKAFVSGSTFPIISADETNEEGEFKLTQLEAGEYDVVFTHRSSKYKIIKIKGIGVKEGEGVRLPLISLELKEPH
jgi:hypothetical protein